MKLDAQPFLYGNPLAVEAIYQRGIPMQDKRNFGIENHDPDHIGLRREQSNKMRKLPGQDIAYGPIAVIGISLVLAALGAGYYLVPVVVHAVFGK